MLNFHPENSVHPERSAQLGRCVWLLLELSQIEFLELLFQNLS